MREAAIPNIRLEFAPGCEEFLTRQARYNGSDRINGGGGIHAFAGKGAELIIFRSCDVRCAAASVNEDLLRLRMSRLNALLFTNRRALARGHSHSICYPMSSRPFTSRPSGVQAPEIVLRSGRNDDFALTGASRRAF